MTEVVATREQIGVRRLQRCARAQALHARGWPIERVAAELGVTPRQVHRDLLTPAPEQAGGGVSVSGDLLDDEQPPGRALVVQGPLACKDDPELFFPRSDTPAAFEAAKAQCASCPVQAVCLEWALVHDERFGVWGGTAPADRQQLLHHRRSG